MPGGLMQLSSAGSGNVLLNGNPSKTFFKTTYKKYTNLAMQQFQINFEGNKTLKLGETSTFDFKILRYADLLMDTYISVDLPNIWSPIIPPDENIPVWRPYEFKWIENLGLKMVQEIRICCGNQQLMKYSGDYLLAMIQRDFSGTKTVLVNDMIGNTLDMTDPANYGKNNGNYPSSFYTPNTIGPQPSILGKTIYIPINAWFTLMSQTAFPLVSLQYNELHIYVTLRPINELFMIRDVYDYTNNFPYIAPNFNIFYMQMYRFLQPPPDITLGFNSYTDQRTIWNSNIHLNCTYCFLSNEEQQLFAAQEQQYLIKQIHETIYYNNVNSNTISLDSTGMISNWMFYLQRSDANLRNQWSNYTNWTYNSPPNFIQLASDTCNPCIDGISIGPGINPDGSLTGLYTTNLASVTNTKDILINMGILLDGEYRENTQPLGFYKYLSKYVRSPNYNTNGPLLYTFNLNSDIFNTQPCGAINLSRFNNIQLEFTTITPPLNLLAQSLAICDPSTGQFIGVNKNSWSIYQYTYNVYLFEERINFVTFSGGNAGLMWAT